MFLPFSQKNGPGTSEDRKPNPESLARPGPRGRGSNHESRITFVPFSPKKGPGTSEDRKPNPESLARPGPRGRGPNHESRIPIPESRLCRFRQKKWSGYLRRPQAKSRKLGPARPEGQGSESRIPNHVFAIFAPKNGPGTSEDHKPNPESLARPEGQGPESRIPNHVFAMAGARRPNHESRIPNHVFRSPESRKCDSRIPNQETRIPNHVFRSRAPSRPSGLQKDQMKRHTT